MRLSEMPPDKIETTASRRQKRSQASPSFQLRGTWRQQASGPMNPLPDWLRPWPSLRRRPSCATGAYALPPTSC